MKLYTIVLNIDSNTSTLPEAEYVADMLAALAQKVLELGVHDCRFKHDQNGDNAMIAYVQEYSGNKEVH